jgi:hypothetical protein
MVEELFHPSCMRWHSERPRKSRSEKVTHGSEKVVEECVLAGDSGDGFIFLPSNPRVAKSSGANEERQNMRHWLLREGHAQVRPCWISRFATPCCLLTRSSRTSLSTLSRTCGSVNLHLRSTLADTTRLSCQPTNDIGRQSAPAAAPSATPRCGVCRQEDCVSPLKLIM